MGRYDFECKKCSTVYEECVAYEKRNTVKCPKCGSKSKEIVISGCGYKFAQPEGTDRWNSESGGHGFRFQHKLPSVIEERKNAEMASHMGADVYNPIDDLSSDSSWGEVK